MTNSTDWSTCRITCWGISAVIGLIVIWIASGAISVLGAILIGLVLAGILGVALTRMACRDSVSSVPSPLAGTRGAEPGDKRAEDTGTTAPAAAGDEHDAPQAAADDDTADEVGAAQAEHNAPKPADAADAARPEGIPAPRSGQADDLKQIKGVGPKLEKLLNEMGFFHFDQIAVWSPEEVAWVDDNLVGFKGRVSRDDWVAQAKTLAAGRDT